MIDVASVAETPVSSTKRGRGRPKKQPESEILDRGAVPEQPVSDEEEPETPSTHAEAPPFPPIQPKTNFETLTNYWNKILTPAQRQQGTVYLYRLQPKMLLVPGRGGRLVNANCEKFNEEDGPITRDLIRSRRRMGVYLLRLNQRVTKPSCEISNCEVEIHGDPTEPNDMPILDVENLDLNYEGNREYVRLLRSRGILKADADDEPSGEGAEEMAATSVLGEIASKAFDKMGQQQPAQQIQSDVSGGVGTELVGLLREQINVNRPPAQQGTVKDQLEGLVTLAKTMTPPPAAAPDMGPYIELQRENNMLVREIMKKDVERAEAEAQKAREEAAQYRAALPQPKTVDEQWDELERAAKRFDRMTGKKQRDEDAEEEKTPSTAAGFWGGLLGALPQIMKSGVELLREGNVMLYNYKLNGVGAVPLNPATGQPGTEPLAPAESEDNEPALSPEDQARMDHMQNVANQLTALASPMLSHLSRNKSGADFARFVIENYGPPAFALLQNTGKETIFAMIQNYPPVWNQIGPTRLPQFQKFLDEFIGYKAVAVQ